ncbi:MAG: hypothetical protein ACOC2H_01895 [Spirochaetota bacterium]
MNFWMRLVAAATVLLLASCEADTYSEFDEIVDAIAKQSSDKEIQSVTFRGFTSTANISDSSDTITVLIDGTTELLTSQVAVFTYTGFAIKKDGVLQENGVTVNDFSGNATDPAVYTVVAEDGTERDYMMYVRASGYEEQGKVTDLVITEWADAGSDLDYIEITNAGDHAVYMRGLTVHYGRDTDGASPQSAESLAEYSEDNSTWQSIPADGIRIAPSEHFLIVDADLNEGNKLEDFRYEWGAAVEPPFKIFRVESETALIGTRDRLSDGPAWLSYDGTVWGRTPPADIDMDDKPVEDGEHFGGAVGKSTYSCLNMTAYVHGTSSAEDFSVWSNGSKTTHSTPGADFYTEVYTE